MIDTGFDFNSTWTNAALPKPKLCKDAHRSFAGDLEDRHGHGTHIASLIGKDNQDLDYCIIVIKYFDPTLKGQDNLINMRKSIVWAIRQDADIINISGGGTERNDVECGLLQLAMKNGAHVVAAAGNEHSDLTKSPYYPAMCDDNIIKVVNINSQGIRHPSSNYTTQFIPNVITELGVNVLGLLPNDSAGYLTGTSQATAIVSGKLARELHKIMLYDERLHKLIQRTV